ncbi:MAG: DNA gyrase subunit A [Phycisphaerales bacterium]|nr:DNA gyrase subunit A [Phycisphaerales bacterium]
MPDQDTPGTHDNSGQQPDDSDGAGAPGAAPVMQQIQDLDIQRELQDSYLTYAMSTIMDRALPDVRDGLKPSQRRILVAMNDLNLRPGKKHLKCAKIAGNTSGDYHPHGESVIYPTLVGLAQKWRMRVPLIDPQGNFGSLNGDPPAAMRYTEARMTHAAVDMLADIKLETVDFQPNYDDRLLEPMVLPGRFPNLLINGGIGIAVGMATSLPPQNPTEVFDAIIRVIENPAISLAELMTDAVDGEGRVVRHGIKGPDFPTGGTVMGRRGIVDAYATGRGKVSVRGVCHIEPLGGEGSKSERQQIVIDQIPYNLAQDPLVKRIAEAVEEDRIQDVSDVRDESGREAQTRIVLELKRGADPRVVENQLFEFTQLQDTFSIMNIALVNRQPRTLALRELIDCYIHHRQDVIRRRTAHLLREAKKRAHVLEGMIYAVCDIDEVIRIIRGSKTREEAIRKLMERRFRIPPEHPHASSLPERLIARVRAADAAGGTVLTRIQAETIGAMRLIQLVGLEIERLTADYRALVEEIEGYEKILGSAQIVLDMIKADCEEMRARFNSPRLTRIEESETDIDIAALIPVEDVALTISHAGYAKRVPLDTYREQNRGGKGIRASDAKDDDFIEHLFVAGTHDDLLCFTDTGRVFKIKVYEIPEMSRTSKGRAMVNLLDLREGERTCAYLAVKNFEEGSDYLTFVSRGGIVKRTPLKDYRNVNKSGLIAVGLKEGDHLLDVTVTDGNDDLLLATASGMAIRFNEQDVRLMGRSAAGVKGIELEEGDEVIGVVAINMAPDPQGDLQTIDPALCLLTITEHGYGKRTFVDEYRVQPESGKMYSQSRGGKGRADIKTNERNGRSVAALGVGDTDSVVVITRGGLLVRMPASSISTIGRGTQGVRVAALNEGDAVISAARVDAGPDVPGPGAEPSEPASPSEPAGPGDPAAF